MVELGKEGEVVTFCMVIFYGFHRNNKTRDYCQAYKQIFKTFAYGDCRTKAEFEAWFEEFIKDLKERKRFISLEELEDGVWLLKTNTDQEWRFGF